MATRKRWLGRLAAAAVLAAAALGAVAAPASAHNYEIGSTPEAGATITTQPDVISVTTNDNLLSLDGINSGMGIQVSGPAGAEHPLYYGDGCVTVFGPTIETEAALGQPGQYTVAWQVVSADGHSVSDSFTFTWKPDADQKLAEGSQQAPTCGGGEKAGATATAAPGAPTTDAGDPAAALADVVWIGAAVLVVLVAVVITLVLVRRKSAGAAPPPSE